MPMSTKIFEYKESKHSKNKDMTLSLSKTERESLYQILNAPERYDFSRFDKIRTKQTDELNFYIPEKWNR